MDPWAQLYEEKLALTRDRGHERIFAPTAYKVVRSLPIVPIVQSEVLNLSTQFPICWAVTDNEPTLCVLRSLLDNSGPAFVHPRGAPLPKAFHAFPIIVPHGDGAFGQKQIVFDRAIADQPTDVGAPLLMSDGRLSRATTMRAQTALQVGRQLPETRALSRFLFEADLLEPWPLHFELGHREKVDISHLMVMSRAGLSQPKIYQAINRFGVDAAILLSAQRLSLFRVSALLSAAKTAVARSKTN